MNINPAGMIGGLPLASPLTGAVPPSNGQVFGNVVQQFVADTNNQQLQADAARVGGLRILDQRFMVIRQAMGLPTARGAAAAAYLDAFVDEMTASGMVAAALARHGIDGALVAGPQD